MEERDILSWCFTVAALTFGVFGFLYSTYATAMFQDLNPPPIVRDLRQVCQALAGVLAVLTGVACFNAYRAAADISTWLIIGCFIVLTGFSLHLVSRVHYATRDRSGPHNAP